MYAVRMPVPLMLLLADSVKTVSRSLLFHEFKHVIRQSHSPNGMTYISEDKVAVYLD